MFEFFRFEVSYALQRQRRSGLNTTWECVIQTFKIGPPENILYFPLKNIMHCSFQKKDIRRSFTSINNFAFFFSLCMYYLQPLLQLNLRCSGMLKKRTDTKVRPQAPDKFHVKYKYDMKTFMNLIFSVCYRQIGDRFSIKKPPWLNRNLYIIISNLPSSETHSKTKFSSDFF